MYEQFYGLSRTPFAVTPDPLMLFMSRVHREALATIIYGVETRKGFIVCTGEVGTGKSTIIRAFFDQAGADAVKLIYIFTPQVTPFEMARFICRELDVADPDSVFDAVPRLQLKLLEVFESGKTVVLMIDEAQLLPAETLEFLRLLSNFETDTEKLIQIVLVGQPEVDTMLARRDMRQVNQRVALRARLGPFSVEESFDYIDHRLRMSGAGEMTQVMSASAAWLVAEAAGGIPRRINILADNALIAGFGAAQRPLGSQLAGVAVRDFVAKSQAAHPPSQQRSGSGWGAARRLRSALVREKEEPVDWVPAAPPSARPAAAVPPAADVAAAAPVAAPISAAPTAAAPAATAPADPAPAVVIHPVLPAAPRPSIGRRPAPARAAAGVPEPRNSPADAAATVAATPAEPVEVPRRASPAAIGEPVAAAGIAIVAPVAPPEPQWIAFSEAAPEWVDYEPAAAPHKLPAMPAREPPNVAGRPAPAISRVAPDGAGRPMRTVVQWPALTRVREGLQAPPRRPELRDLPDPVFDADG